MICAVVFAYAKSRLIFSSVKVAEWPPFGKELFTLLTVRYDCNLSICIFCYFSKYYVEISCVCLFDLLLYVHGKQLRSCYDDQCLNHTVPGQELTACSS